MPNTIVLGLVATTDIVSHVKAGDQHSLGRLDSGFLQNYACGFANKTVLLTAMALDLTAAGKIS